VDWDDLRYVLAIARDRTLSRAAERLKATHTTVGRRLKTIEQSLGVRLFDPTPDGYVATSAGREVIDSAERVEAEMLALEARVLGQDSQLEGKLRVSTLDLLFRQYHQAIASFIERYPRVELTLTTTDAEISLLRREADVVLRLTNTPPEYAVGRRIAEVPFGLYASRALVERVGVGAKLSEFPFIHWDERLEPRWLDQWIAEHAPGARIALRIDTSMTMLSDLVRSGIGAHFLARFEGDADPSLVRLAEGEPKFNRGLWLLTHSELRSTSRVRAFMEHIEAEVKKRGPTP
jgi:DNA-binding transcriptional LysR family regulator